MSPMPTATAAQASTSSGVSGSPAGQRRRDDAEDRLREKERRERARAVLAQECEVYHEVEPGDQHALVGDRDAEPRGPAGRRRLDDEGDDDEERRPHHRLREEQLYGIQALNRPRQVHGALGQEKAGPRHDHVTEERRRAVRHLAGEEQDDSGIGDEDPPSFLTESRSPGIRKWARTTV